MSPRSLALSLAAEALALCLVSACWVRATVAVKTLSRAFEEAQQRLADGLQAKTAVEEFERTQEALAREGRALARVIPADEQEPLELIKQLTAVAYEATVTRLTVSVGKRAAAALPHVGASPGGAQSLSAVPIYLDGELEFAHVMDWLARIRALERLTTLEELRIERSPDLVPRQSVSLTLNAYTFAAP